MRRIRRVQRSATVGLACGLLAASSALAASIQEFEIPNPSTKQPEAIAAGPDGNMWFAERDLYGVGKVTPAGVITDYDVSTPAGPDDIINGITGGPDGNIWFTRRGPNRIDRIKTDGTDLVGFSLNPAVGFPQGITSASDGNLWFAAADAIGKITPAGAITTFALGAGQNALDIVQGPDGQMWFTDTGTDSVGHLPLNATVPGQIVEFALPGANAEPQAITTGPDGAGGRALWITEENTAKAARFPATATTSAHVTEFALPPGTGKARDIAEGPDGKMYAPVEVNGNTSEIVRIDPNVGLAGEYLTPTANVAPRGIALGPDGFLWFTEGKIDKIGRLIPDLSPGVVTAPADPVGEKNATLHGTVDPNGSATSYHFEYRAESEAAFRSTPDVAAGAGGAPIAVDAALTGLGNGTKYRFRLVATNAVGTSTGSERTFSTIGPPLVTTLPPEGIGPRFATFVASVDANGGGDTTLIFRYGPTGSKLPLKTATAVVPADGASHRVGLPVTGLLRGVEYEVQAGVDSAVGHADGEVVRFRTSLRHDGDRIYALDSEGQLVVMGANGSGRRRVPLQGLSRANISAVNAAISPDETRVALISHPCHRKATTRPEPADLSSPQENIDEDCDKTTRVDIATLDGKQSWKVMGVDYVVRHVNPVFSPSGSLVALLASGPNGDRWEPDVWVAHTSPPFYPTVVKRGRTQVKDDWVSGHYTGLAWGNSGLIVGNWGGNFFSTSLMFASGTSLPDPWGKRSGGGSELVPFLPDCGANCGRKTTTRPEPADLTSGVSRVPEVPDPPGRLALSYAAMNETCSPGVTCRYRSNSVIVRENGKERYLNSYAPGPPAAWSPTGDELLLTDGSVLDTETGVVSRTLGDLDTLRRVVAWKACTQGCGFAAVVRSSVAGDTVVRFPDTAAVAKPITKVVTMTNGGAGSVQFTDPYITSDLPGFSLLKKKKPRIAARAAKEPCANSTLAAGESCTIAVRFDGRTPGVVTALLFPNITTDPWRAVSLTARGRGAKPVVRRLRITSKRLRPGAKKLVFAYRLSQKAGVRFDLVRNRPTCRTELGTKRCSGAPQPIVTGRTRRAARAASILVPLKAGLAVGRYTLSANAYTDRWESPIRSVKVRVRAKG